MKYTIALVEDEEDLNKLIQTYLKKAGYEVIPFYNGKDALNNINTKVHLWILDIMLPNNISGYDIIKEIRKNNEMMPVIFTSARDKDLDKIIGLELGSDDYITKPFSLEELVLRVAALFRRVDSSSIEKSDIVTFSDDNHELIIDSLQHQLTIDGEEIILTAAEWRIVSYLSSNAGVLITRSQILEECFDYSFESYERVVDTHIKNIRAKLKSGNWIETVRGYGYRFTGKKV